MKRLNFFVKDLRFIWITWIAMFSLFIYSDYSTGRVTEDTTWNVYFIIACLLLLFGQFIIAPLIRLLKSRIFINLLIAGGAVAILLLIGSVSVFELEELQAAKTRTLSLIFSVCTFVASFQLLQRRKKDLKANEAYKQMRKGRYESSKPTVLYLRPFKYDSRLMKSVWTDTATPIGVGNAVTDVSMEDQLVRCAELIGDVYSLGDSTKTSERLYAAPRFETTDANWQEVVLTFLKNADIIIIVPSLNEGTKWELEKIFEHKLVQKTLFVGLPNVQDWKGRRVDKVDDWAAIQSVFRRHGYNPPNEFVDGCVFTFDPLTKSPEVYSPILPDSMTSTTPTRSLPVCRAMDHILNA